MHAVCAWNSRPTRASSCIQSDVSCPLYTPLSRIAICPWRCAVYHSNKQIRNWTEIYAIFCYALPLLTYSGACLGHVQIFVVLQWSPRRTRFTLDRFAANKSVLNETDLSWRGSLFLAVRFGAVSPVGCMIAALTHCRTTCGYGAASM